MDELTRAYDPLKERWYSRDLWMSVGNEIDPTRAVVARVCDGKIALRTGHVAWFPVADVVSHWCYLASDADHDYFVIDDDGLDECSDEVSELVSYVDIRQLMSDLPTDEMTLVWSALALTAWHRRARFCEVCGEPLTAVDWGRKRVCPNNHIVFPRTDPAVIMGVLDPADRLLVARNARWPQGRISVLAGFVEAGESLEEAVRREVREEVGIDVDDVRYVGSQPWPFPRSLMMAFYGWTQERTPRPDTEEIAEAFFVDRDELRERVASGELTLPAAASVGRALIEHWLGGELA
ncbi:NAD(+) diphosphatase [Arcanobacterium phocae]|uniref:NAD(+) diphosphatase n=1 Tax=Arcanobacterium phocae TaxID=131112 RepID=UPI001C0F01F4|nr:NAD(+) diphosphatase [Arcanobacterium phocae]